MFAVKICGYPDLYETIEQFQPTHIISAIEKIPRLGEKHLHVRVSDVSAPLEGYTLPRSEHLINVLNFTRDLETSDRLLVHCFAGQSRSTAYAIAVLIQHGMTPHEAFDHIAAIRPILLPNRLIVRLTDQHFELDGVLDRLVEDYYAGEFERPRLPSVPSKADVEAMQRLNALFKRIGNEDIADE